MVCWHAVLPAVLNSRIHRGCPRLIPSSDCSHCPTASLSLDNLHTSVSRSSPLHAFPLGALRSTRQQVSIPVSRDCVTLPHFREATITATLPCCECMRWDVTCTHVFCARRTQVHTRSDCVHTRDDTVRLDYASRFVRVIYSSHIVSIKLGTVTPPQKKGSPLLPQKKSPPLPPKMNAHPLSPQKKAPPPPKKKAPVRGVSALYCRAELCSGHPRPSR